MEMMDVWGIVGEWWSLVSFGEQCVVCCCYRRNIYGDKY